MSGKIRYVASSSTFSWPALHERYPSVPAPWHFLHSMALTVWACIGFALTLNRLVFGQRAEFVFQTKADWRAAIVTLRS